MNNSRVKLYKEIEADYVNAYKEIGVQFAEHNDPNMYLERVHKLKEKGALVRNKGASVATSQISGACVACTGDVESKTFFLSMHCNRNCYFCFNQNQDDYEKYIKTINNPTAEIAELAASGKVMTNIALTGGEPLLHPEETVGFFKAAHEYYPKAYTRLYTAGDVLNKSLFKQLQDAALSEIRFSIKLDDPSEIQKNTLQNIQQALEYVPHVMVEMPVIPKTGDQMRKLLHQLNSIGIFGINLLEFCFPLLRWDEFKKRGFLIKNPPFPILYDYIYAGGLPVFGSEELACDLIEFALDEKLDLSTHYCSLENKHRDEIFQRNVPYEKMLKLHALDKEDYFFKSIVVFDHDSNIVSKELQRIVSKKTLAKNIHNKTINSSTFEIDPEDGSLQFHPKYLRDLRYLDVAFYLSYNVVEELGDTYRIRELKLEPLSDLLL